MDRSLYLRRDQQGAIIPLGAILWLWATVSVLWTSGPKLFAFAYAISLGLSFILGRRLDCSLVWPIAILILGAASPILGPNYLGISCAIAFAWLVLNDYCLLSALAGFGVAYSQSRGGLLTIAGFILWYLWSVNRWLIVPLLAAAVVFIIDVKPDLGLSFASHLGIWQDTLNHMTPLGHGLWSFQHEYSNFSFRTNMPTEIAPHAYNDFIELIFELGVGAALIGPLFILCHTKADFVSRGLLITFALASLTFFPLHIPILGQLWALTLGQASKGES